MSGVFLASKCQVVREIGKIRLELSYRVNVDDELWMCRQNDIITVEII